jgi:hypothetical protein
MTTIKVKVHEIDTGAQRHVVKEGKISVADASYLLLNLLYTPGYSDMEVEEVYSDTFSISCRRDVPIRRLRMTGPSLQKPRGYAYTFEASTNPREFVKLVEMVMAFATINPNNRSDKVTQLLKQRPAGI